MSDTKVAIMTGTGQGIGRGCAIEMAKAGYKVSLMSPSNRSVELAEELGGIGRSGSVLDAGDLLVRQMALHLVESLPRVVRVCHTLCSPIRRSSIPNGRPRQDLWRTGLDVFDRSCGKCDEAAIQAS